MAKRIFLRVATSLFEKIRHVYVYVQAEDRAQEHVRTTKGDGCVSTFVVRKRKTSSTKRKGLGESIFFIARQFCDANRERVGVFNSDSYYFCMRSLCVKVLIDMHGNCIIQQQCTLIPNLFSFRTKYLTLPAYVRNRNPGFYPFNLESSGSRKYDPFP